MRPKPGGLPSHYERVSVLHLSSAQITKDNQKDLSELLKMRSCVLRMLDVSNTQIDGAALATTLTLNSSLTSLDVRMVPNMKDSFEVIGSSLLRPESTSKLAYLRCDAFEVLEGETVLSLRERPLGAGAMRLLTGLFRNNRDVQELDLAATMQQPEWVYTLIETIASNKGAAVSAVYLPYNPAIDESEHPKMTEAVEKRGLKVTLHF